MKERKRERERRGKHREEGPRDERQRRRAR